MLTLPSPRRLEDEGVSLTAWPAREGEERAIVEAAIALEREEYLRNMSGAGTGEFV
jgi:hypothetical protein